MSFKVHRLYAVLLTLNLAGFPLVASVSTALGVDSTPVSILMRAAILSMSGILILVAISGRHAAFVRNLFWTPFLLFWAVYALRLLHDTSYRADILARPPLDYWIWAIGACLIPTLALVAAVRHDAYRLAYQWSGVAMFIAGGLILAFGGTEVTPELGLAYETGRLRLEALNPISVGHLGVSLLLLSLWPLASEARWPSGTRRILVLAGAAMGLYLMVAAASRGPIVSAIAVMLCYAFATNARGALKLVALTFVLGAVGYLLAVRLEEAGQFQMLSRALGAVGGEDFAVVSRKEAMMGALGQFAQNPIIGDALEEKTTRFYPHNIVVESLMATGITGSILLLLVIGVAVRAAFRVIRWCSPHGWVALIFLQYLMAAQFSGAIYGVTTMWALLGATIALSHGAYGANLVAADGAVLAKDA